MDFAFDLLLVWQYYNQGRDGYLNLGIVVYIMMIPNIAAVSDFIVRIRDGLSIRMKLFDLFLNLIQAKVFVK